MKVLKKLADQWAGIEYPFLIHSKGNFKFTDINVAAPIDLREIKAGDIVALIGDFDPQTISILLHLIDINTIIVPLTEDTRSQHNYFFEAAMVDVVIEGNNSARISHKRSNHLVETLRAKNHAGLVLFSSGTTGRPKAILHDLTVFLKRFSTSRPTHRAVSFLLFDHIGGINTLLHTLFNKGTVVAAESRSVEDVLSICRQFEVEVLPTTPTFLRLMLMSGLVPNSIPKTLKIITYGTERMDQPTLDLLCKNLPRLEFRQTFGMSELGILRVKSESSNSLYMKIGGEGIETRVVDDVLQIRSSSRMLGYLNAPSPFDLEGWYKTNDIVSQRDGYIRVIGRTTEVINVGGLKFMASEVERVALGLKGVALVKAEGKPNPITGQHVELTVQPIPNFDIDNAIIKTFLKSELPNHMVPKRIKIGTVKVGHRHKID